MRMLWTYLRPHGGLALLALLLAAASQVLALIDPIIFGRIIDEYAIGRAGKTGDQLLAGVLGLLALALAVAILSRLAKALQEYVTRLVVQKLGTQIFNDGLRQVMRLRFQEFEELRSGETLSLLQKVRSDSERFINAFINTAFAAGVGVAFLCWYSVTRHWLLVPVFFVGVLLLGGLTGLLSRQIRSQQRSIMRETNRNSGFITESLRNIELIKSLGLTYPEIRRLQAQTQQIFALEMQKIKRIRLLSFLQGMILSVLKLSVLFALLWLILRDVLSTGELIAMQFISVAIFAPLQELGNLILAYREADASLNHYAALMARPVERNPESAQDSGPIQRVRFGEVRFRHQGAAENALDGVSFEARLGDTVAFVGPSGSGKSTLFKLLVGLYAPDHGEVYYNDVSTRDLRFNPTRRQIGFVTQETHLFLRHAAREHAAGQARCHRRGNRRRHAPGVLRQRAGALARRTGHDHRRRRRQTVGRGTAAPVHRPRAGAPAPAADLRRSHLGAGLADRRADHPDDPRRVPARRPDHHPDCPPAVHHHARRHHLRPGERPRGRARQPRRTAGRQGPVLRHVAPADRRTAGRTRPRTAVRARYRRPRPRSRRIAAVTG